MTDLGAIRQHLDDSDSDFTIIEVEYLLALLDEAVELLTGTASPDWDDEVHAFLVRLGRDQ